MRLYLDTEFVEDGRTIDLISIALVSESGQEFYRQNSQADFRRANEFVVEHVLPQLWPCPRGIAGARHVYGLCADKTCVWRPKRLIRDELHLWVREQTVSPYAGTEGTRGTYEPPEFWGYYADYDWVALCQLFGAMGDLPREWPVYCRDIKQYADDLLGPQSLNLDELVPIAQEHSALADARWNREAHEYLMKFERSFYPVGDRRYSIHAGREVSGAVDQEPQGVRSLEKEVRGYPGGEDTSGEDLQRGGGEVVITPEDYAKALNTEVRYPDG